ncbi:hypothetical protein [Cohnella panacarvi]|uniref:RCC1 domain-containing protein n=1 Tax=Cohnella panacarvi TaxID=400776 RepID=UPI00248187FB|nr:hypothetical protein [Cohnella panacarvi]
MCAVIGSSAVTVIGSRDAAAAFPKIKSVATGLNRSYALGEDGSLWSWGGNNRYYIPALPRIDTPYDSGPLKLELTGVSSLSAGRSHTLIVKDGDLWGVGDNSEDQLGIDSVELFATSMPKKIPGISNIKSAAAGYLYSVVLKNDGTLWEFGKNYSDFSARDTHYRDFHIPRQVPYFPGNESVQEVAAGYYHTVAIKADRTLVAWGANDKGQLGIGMTDEFWDTPASVYGIDDVKSIAAGGMHTLALKYDGTVYAWGTNSCGALGRKPSEIASSNTPLQVEGLSDIVAISAGDVHNLALGKDGKIRIWGCEMTNDDLYADLAVHEVPTTIETPISIKSIAAGDLHSLAVTSSGRLWAWGLNDVNQSGPSPNVFIPYPRGFKLEEYAPSPPYNLKAAAGEGQVTLTWNSDVPYPKSNIVLMREGSTGPFKTVATIILSGNNSGTYSYTVNGLAYSPFKPYEFRVVTVDGDDRKSPQSESIFAQPKKIFQLPDNTDLRLIPSK